MQERRCSRRELLAAMLAGGSSCAQRERLPRVRVAIFRGEEFTPLAAALGYFAAAGLPVEVNEVASTSKAMQALFGGSAEVVTGGFDHAVHLAAEGRLARSFVVLTRRSPLALVASPKSKKRIERVADLAGGTIGISAFGSSGQHFVTHLLAKHGVGANDVKFAVTGGGHSVTVASIEHGEMDAIVTLPASLAILRRRVPELRVLADATSAEGSRAVFGVEEYPGVAMMAQAAWLGTHREAASALAKAMVRTLGWVRSHSAAELQQRLRGGAGVEGELAGLEATIDAASMDGRMPKGGAEAVRAALASSYPSIRGLDLGPTYTDEFVSQ